MKQCKWHSWLVQRQSVSSVRYEDVKPSEYEWTFRRFSNSQLLSLNLHWTVLYVARATPLIKHKDYSTYMNGLKITCILFTKGSRLLTTNSHHAVTTGRWKYGIFIDATRSVFLEVFCRLFLGSRVDLRSLFNLEVFFRSTSSNTFSLVATPSKYPVDAIDISSQVSRSF